MALNPVKTAGLTARGMARADRQREQQSPFDVWTNTGAGITANQQEFFADPVGFLEDARDSRARQDAMMNDVSQWDSASLSDAFDSTAASLSATGDAFGKIAEADGALATTGAVFATMTALEQTVSTMFSAIPFPAFPAVRVMDTAIGLPHAHAHPPNLIPPAPPVPFPSAGPVIPIPYISGAATVLINNMPAGRCGDMGMGIWCGGYFPMYEIFLGSSSVWLEGARAARVAIDITKHCIFTTPKPSDPPIGPMVGTTVSSSPNVLIGGIPMPSLTSAAVGKAFKAVFKGLAKLKSLAKGADDVAEELGEAAAKVGDDVAEEAGEAAGQFSRKAHLDEMASVSAARRNSMLGAPKMTAAQRRAISRQASEYGTNVRRLTDSQFDELAGPNTNAAFNNQTNTILLRQNATHYEAFHELQHARHMNEIGPDAYRALGNGNPDAQRYIRERYVYDRIMENSDELGLTPCQRGHATDYVRRVGRDAGMGDPDFNFPPNATRDDVLEYYRHTDYNPDGRTLNSLEQIFGN